ncbi:Signal recognition particle receptor subunit beta [Taphrina deformans PYCC 5710]|uniref:Signal recognition particle receptor subunit beta n=1 Tax=Taphrina deformans (strain PYCC 5710 / ATCC 11124 / CBS 356.35 / IMI 108563 / JCM 9778 / NBRC 8474) TaxID=1097556 RepID=R4XAP5_TAPDE|nr:Signal recognition particle receptor subunit beta [Taphrina deformans PYCC 5710]|eukprot:CCG82919.1 Signal recognition particle receptor subunit beta [Taphrina deformans PYCC 5710]
MQWLVLVSTLVLATILAVAFFIYQNGAVNIPLAPAQPTLLLVGPSNSGKTSLFQKLVHDKRNTLTCTTQLANTGYYSLESGKKVKIVDVPGHPKLFNSFKSFTPTSIAFVIDSSTIAKNADVVTRLLIDVISHARKASITELSILANKSDFFTSLSTEKITELLEAEIEQIRQQKSGIRMDSIEDKDEEDEWLQDLSGPLKLADECLMFSGSVLKDDVSPWEEWVESTFS